MLALTDEALTLLCIAAGRVAPAKRGRWLRRFAAQLERAPAQVSNGDPKYSGARTIESVPCTAQRTRRISSGAARVRLHRSRLAAGHAVLRICVDFTAASAALFDAGLLQESEIDDAAAVTRAIERIVSLLPVRL